MNCVKCGAGYETFSSLKMCFSCQMGGTPEQQAETSEASTPFRLTVGRAGDDMGTGHDLEITPYVLDGKAGVDMEVWLEPGRDDYGCIVLPYDTAVSLANAILTAAERAKKIACIP